MKIYVIRFNDLAYLETIEYKDHRERYARTKGILPERIFLAKNKKRGCCKIDE